jgi:hypothetical protein
MTGTRKETLSGTTEEKEGHYESNQKRNSFRTKENQKKTMAGTRKETKKPSQVPQSKRKETLNPARIIKERTVDLARKP